MGLNPFSIDFSLNQSEHYQTYITEIEKHFDEYCIEKQIPTKEIHILYPDKKTPDDKTVSRLYGKPLGVGAEQWPVDFEDNPMVHVITVDLKEFPQLCTEQTKEYRSVSLFVSQCLEGEAGYDISEEALGKLTKVICCTEDNMAKGFSEEEYSFEGLDNLCQSGLSYKTHSIKVPTFFFEEGAVNQVYDSGDDRLIDLWNLFREGKISFMGDQPWWFPEMESREKEHNKNFILQLSSSFVPFIDEEYLYMYSDFAFTRQL